MPRGLALLVGLGVLLGLAAGWAIPEPPLTRTYAGHRVPYRSVRYRLSPTHVADVAPASRHASNGQGTRGDALGGWGPEVLLVGGSTTECNLLDEGDALGARLGAALPGEVRVAALAQAGVPLFGLVGEAEEFMGRVASPAVVVGMFGANEAQSFFNHAPWVRSTADGPWEAWIDPDAPLGVRGRVETYRGWYQPGNRGRFFEAPRRAYAAPGAWRDDLHPAHVPLLQAELRNYVGQLERLRLATERSGAALVLATQPVAPWAPPGEGRGWAPFVYAELGEGFVPSPALTDALVEAFNAQTRGFAAEHELPLVDLARELRGCADCFIDQWHFGNTGARRAASALAPVVHAALESRQSGSR